MPWQSSGGTFTVGAQGSIPGQGTKILQAARYGTPHSHTKKVNV